MLVNFEVSSLVSSSKNVVICLTLRCIVDDTYQGFREHCCLEFLDKFHILLCLDVVFQLS